MKGVELEHAYKDFDSVIDGVFDFSLRYYCNICG